MNTQKIPENLLDEAEKLSKLNENELYTILGNQLLWQISPSKMTDIVTHIPIIERLTETAKTSDVVPSEQLLPEFDIIKGFFHRSNEIGRQYVKQIEISLKEALCTKEGKCKEEILEVINGGVKATVAASAQAILQKIDLSPALYSIVIIIPIIILKKGFEAFCRNDSNLEQ